MAQINVTLRIVGLYFNETVRINDRRGLTVRDVLDKYISEHSDLSVAGGLEYIRFPFEINGKDFVKTFNYNFGGTYNYEGDNTLVVAANPELPTLAAPDGISLGKQEREEGIYTLSEDFEDEFTSVATKEKVGLVWQYYITSNTGVNKSKTPVGRGFLPFGKNPPLPAPPLYDLEEGDTITWRLVAIARGPNYKR